MENEISNVDSIIINTAPSAVADAPFNLPSADVVFLTIDNVEFHAHKAILSIASPFFADMFSLQQPITTDVGQVNRPVIPITEHSEIFEILLRLLYPVVEPSLTNRVQVEHVLEASMKYDIEKATTILRRTWMDLIHHHDTPLQAFATACRLRLQKEAMVIARAWKAKASWSSYDRNFDLTMAGSSYSEDMANLPAGIFYRFLYFLRSNTDNEVNFMDAGDPEKQGSGVSTVSQAKANSSTKAPYRESNPDIILRSRDGINIPAHRLVLNIALAEGLLESPSLSASHIPVYEVDADADSICTFLQLCYPFPREAENRIVSDARMLDAVMQLAQRYRVRQMTDFLEVHSESLSRYDPLSCYFLAVKWQWEHRKREASSKLLSWGATILSYSVSYRWAMEDISTKHYVEFLRWLHSAHYDPTFKFS
jgi:hypothetical protein